MATERDRVKEYKGRNIIDILILSSMISIVLTVQTKSESYIYSPPKSSFVLSRRTVCTIKDDNIMACKKYYDRNREKILARERANYKLRSQQYEKEHRCKHCGDKLAKDYKNKICRRCLDNRLKYTRRIIQPLKDAAFRAYGGYICACCSETEPIFLSIDHIDGGGYEHRKTIHAGYSMYSWLKRHNYPKGFQVLCRNCNWGKHIEGTCPHKIKKVKLA